MDACTCGTYGRTTPDNRGVAVNASSLSVTILESPRSVEWLCTYQLSHDLLDDLLNFPLVCHHTAGAGINEAQTIVPVLTKQNAKVHSQLIMM